MDILKASNLSNVPGVKHGFLGRRGGASPKPFASLNTSLSFDDVPTRVMENRARICYAFQLERHLLYTPNQVHGNGVIRIDKSMSVKDVANQKADALWTTDSKLALGIQTADCAPVIISTVDGQAIGIAHAGWRGAVCGVIEALIKDMCETLHIKPEQLVAAIGPCIGLESFEVGEEVLQEASKHIFTEGLYTRDRSGKAHLHLAWLVKRILERAGVESVEVINKCTLEDAKHFFSARRDGKQSGRQLSLVMR